LLLLLFVCFVIDSVQKSLDTPSYPEAFRESLLNDASVRPTSQKSLYRPPTDTGYDTEFRSPKMRRNLTARCLDFVKTLLYCNVSNRIRDQTDGGSMGLWNVGILPHHYTVSQPGRTRLEALEDGSSMDLWNVGLVLQQYTVSQPWRPQLETPEDGGSMNFWNVGILPRH